MGTKTNPGAFDCYQNALPDEPMFVLLARDPHAPTTVQYWIARRAADIESGRRSVDDNAMLAEANACAVAMCEWRLKHEGLWRMPGLTQAPPEKDSAQGAYYAGLHEIIAYADKLMSRPPSPENSYTAGERDAAWMFKSMALRALRTPDRPPFLERGQTAHRFEEAPGTDPSPFEGKPPTPDPALGKRVSETPTPLFEAESEHTPDHYAYTSAADALARALVELDSETAEGTPRAVTAHIPALAAPYQPPKHFLDTPFKGDGK